MHEITEPEISVTKLAPDKDAKEYLRIQNKDFNQLTSYDSPSLLSNRNQRDIFIYSSEEEFPNYGNYNSEPSTHYKGFDDYEHNALTIESHSGNKEFSSTEDNDHNSENNTQLNTDKESLLSNIEVRSVEEFGEFSLGQSTTNSLRQDIELPAHRQTNEDMMKQNIKISIFNHSEKKNSVNLRFRPLEEFDISQNEFITWSVEAKKGFVHITRNDQLAASVPNNIQDKFNEEKSRILSDLQFKGRFFKKCSTNVEIYEKSIQQAVIQITEGFHCLIITCGLNDSGKKHTFIGNQKHHGLIPQAMSDLFAHLESYTNIHDNGLRSIQKNYTSAISETLKHETNNSRKQIHFVVRMAIVSLNGNKCTDLLKQIETKQKHIFVPKFVKHETPLAVYYEAENMEWKLFTNLSSMLSKFAESVVHFKRNGKDHLCVFIRVEKVLVEFNLKEFSKIESNTFFRRIKILERTEGSLAFYIPSNVSSFYNSKPGSLIDNNLLSFFEIIDNNEFATEVQQHLDSSLISKLLSFYFAEFTSSYIFIITINPSTRFAVNNSKLLHLAKKLSEKQNTIKTVHTAYSNMSFYCKNILETLQDLEIKNDEAETESKKKELLATICLPMNKPWSKVKFRRLLAVQAMYAQFRFQLNDAETKLSVKMEENEDPKKINGNSETSKLKQQINLLQSQQEKLSAHIKELQEQNMTKSEHIRCPEKLPNLKLVYESLKADDESYLSEPDIFAFKEETNLQDIPNIFVNDKMNFNVNDANVSQNQPIKSLHRRSGNSISFECKDKKTDRFLDKLLNKLQDSSSESDGVYKAKKNKSRHNKIKRRSKKRRSNYIKRRSDSPMGTCSIESLDSSYSDQNEISKKKINPTIKATGQIDISKNNQNFGSNLNFNTYTDRKLTQKRSKKGTLRIKTNDMSIKPTTGFQFGTSNLIPYPPFKYPGPEKEVKPIVVHLHQHSKDGVKSEKAQLNIHSTNSDKEAAISAAAMLRHKMINENPNQNSTVYPGHAACVMPSNDSSVFVNFQGEIDIDPNLLPRNRLSSKMPRSSNYYSSSSSLSNSSSDSSHKSNHSIQKKKKK